MEPKPRKSSTYPTTGKPTAVVREVKAGTFKDTCLQLLDQVQQGEFELVVTKHGKPVARVVPTDAGTASGFGFMRGTVLKSGDIVSPDPDAWGDLA